MARGIALSALCSMSSTRACGSFIRPAHAETSLLMGTPASSFSLKVKVNCSRQRCVSRYLRRVVSGGKIAPSTRYCVGAYQLLPEGFLLLSD